MMMLSCSVEEVVLGGRNLEPGDQKKHEILDEPTSRDQTEFCHKDDCRLTLRGCRVPLSWFSKQTF